VRSVSFDLETKLVRKGHCFPEIICAQWKYENEPAQILGNDDPERLRQQLRRILCGPDRVITLNGPYEYICSLNFGAVSFDDIAQGFSDRRLVDVGTVQKLRDIASDGKLSPRGYSLNALGIRAGQKDREQEKKGDDVWRLRYGELDGLPVEEYPLEARLYALEDVDETMAVWEWQQRLGDLPEPWWLHCEADFHLGLIKARGMWTDRARVRKAWRKVKEQLSPQMMEPLFEAGILRRPVPPKVFKTGRRTKGKPEELNTKALKARVKEVAEANNVPILLTKKAKDIATSEQMLSRLDGMDDVLTLHIRRQGLKKLDSTYFPRLGEGIIYPSFNILVESGRTSSRTDKTVPSMNMQNIPREAGEMGVRECFIPRPGHLFLSVDFGNQELCTTAQACLDLFGYSRMAETINKGVNLHDYLGAQIASVWDEEFRHVCHALKASTQWERYEAFLGWKEVNKVGYKHYRTMAKPTGLGYPGGLGPRTFIEYARTTYDVPVSFTEAQQLRDLWLAAYPEMVEYLQRWVPAQATGAQRYNEEDDRVETMHSYISPLGMVRENTTYCSTANGFAMQTPSAEVTKLALCAVSRECWEAGNSVLRGARITNYIHDELFLEIKDQGPEHNTAIANRVCEIMVREMRKITPDINVTAEPALMQRWTKDADPVYNEEGYLIPWEMAA